MGPLMAGDGARAAPAIRQALWPDERVALSAMVRTGPPMFWVLFFEWLVLFFQVRRLLVLTDRRLLMVRVPRLLGPPRLVAAWPRDEVLVLHRRCGMPGRCHGARLHVGGVTPLVVHALGIESQEGLAMLTDAIAAP